MSNSKKFEIDNIIIGQIKKIKVPKNTKSKLGIEFDPDVLRDSELCEQILKSNTYTPTNQKLLDFYEDISRLLVT